MTDARLAGERLLVVFAHPDDESLACGGLMARCHDAGVPVSLLCLTSGAGVPPDPALAAIRQIELAEAAEVLGIGIVMLREHADGYLPWTEPSLVEHDIHDAIAQTLPSLVVTFGADGLYWHPDHIAVHERTTRVVERLGDSGPALAYVTMPAGRMRALVDAVAGRATDGLPHVDVLGITAVDAFGAEAAPPTYALDVSAHAARKLRALRCHRSQSSTGALALLRDDEASAFLGVEHYHRALVGSASRTLLDALTSSAA